MIAWWETTIDVLPICAFANAITLWLDQKRMVNMKASELHVKLIQLFEAEHGIFDADSPVMIKYVDESGELKFLTLTDVEVERHGPGCGGGQTLWVMAGGLLMGQINWRRTWLGRLLNLHSPSAEMVNKCLCQKNKKSIVQLLTEQLNRGHGHG